MFARDLTSLTSFGFNSAGTYFHPNPKKPVKAPVPAPPGSQTPYRTAFDKPNRYPEYIEL